MNSSNDAHNVQTNLDAPRGETENENEAATTRDDQALEQAETTLAALDTLEELLADGKSDDDETSSSPRIEQDGQYNIPLLDEVVVPGDEMVGLPPTVTPADLSPVAQRLFDRLASEIDVIVQTGVDDALKAAAKNIRARVKQHVAIVLPEILDELSQEDEPNP